MTDVLSKIRRGVYTRPSMPNKPSKVCFGPECGASIRDVTKFCPHCGFEFEKSYDKLLASFKAQQKEYQQECNKLHEQFKEDALDFCGIKGHKKADKAFGMAWEDSHGDGLEAVVYKLEELCELLD